MRKTKIICTLGPSSGSEEVIKELFKAGMNVGRMNMSHGSLMRITVKILRHFEK